LSPIGGLLTGPAQAAGQRAASPGQVGGRDTAGDDKADKAKDTEDEDETDEDETDEDDKDAATAAPGDGGSERAPIHVEVVFDPDRPDAPVTVRLDPDNPPEPPAGTSPQDKR
jgi:hypothetical protein